jgi:hypothetical protein
MSATQYEQFVSHSREGRTQWQLKNRHHTIFLEPNGSSKTFGSIDPKDPYYMTGNFFVSKARATNYPGRVRYPVTRNPTFFRIVWIQVIDKLGRCGWISTSVVSKPEPSKLDECVLTKIIDDVIGSLTMPERNDLLV